MATRKFIITAARKMQVKAAPASAPRIARAKRLQELLAGWRDADFDPAKGKQALQLATDLSRDATVSRWAEEVTRVLPGMIRDAENYAKREGYPPRASSVSSLAQSAGMIVHTLQSQGGKAAKANDWQRDPGLLRIFNTVITKLITAIRQNELNPYDIAEWRMSITHIENEIHDVDQQMALSQCAQQLSRLRSLTDRDPDAARALANSTVQQLQAIYRQVARTAGKAAQKLSGTGTFDEILIANIKRWIDRLQRAKGADESGVKQAAEMVIRAISGARLPSRAGAVRSSLNQALIQLQRGAYTSGRGADLETPLQLLNKAMVAVSAAPSGKAAKGTEMVTKADILRKAKAAGVNVTKAGGVEGLAELENQLDQLEDQLQDGYVSAMTLNSALQTLRPMWQMSHANSHLEWAQRSLQALKRASATYMPHGDKLVVPIDAEGSAKSWVTMALGEVEKFKATMPSSKAIIRKAKAAGVSQKAPVPAQSPTTGQNLAVKYRLIKKAVDGLAGSNLDNPRALIGPIGRIQNALDAAGQMGKTRQHDQIAQELEMASQSTTYPRSFRQKLLNASQLLSQAMLDANRGQVTGS